jgi:hypothetical protein
MIDRYTKIVLTVIAASLMALLAENLMPRASAYDISPKPSCGMSIQEPCYITNFGGRPIYVENR